MTPLSRLARLSAAERRATTFVTAAIPAMHTPGAISVKRSGAAAGCGA
jgi:hypothetical protein